jgi:DNA-binding response OmpR family regulator
VSSWNAAPPRVLFVDDEVTVSRATGRLLARMGFDVVMAETPLEAMALAHDETIDVVVADIHLPKFSGVELAHELRAAGLDAPILFISGDPKALDAAGTAGFARTSVLPKPFSAADLNSAIWATLGGERTPSDAE